jgi:hypothetical protein
MSVELQKNQMNKESEIYISTAEAFSLFKEDDKEFNVSNNIQYGICFYCEKYHGIKQSDIDEELITLRLFCDFDKNSFDGNLAAPNKEGAELRVLILLFCYNICQDDNLYLKK